MKKLLLGFLLFFSAHLVCGEETIKIIASGSAFTKEKAISVALRTALEKGAGVFISSQTVMKDNQLVFDEISSLANGTISKYEIIESSYIEKFNEHQVTVNATIEVGKFVNFIKAAGVNVSFEGASFAQNVKLHEYYKAEEPKILSNFLDRISWSEIFQMFDKKLIADEPKLYRFSPSDFQIPLEKDWRMHENNELIKNVRLGNDVVLEINKTRYINPFYLKYKSPIFSFSGPDFRDKFDAISDTIRAWNDLFSRRRMWTGEEIKNYAKLTESDIDKIYDWHDFAQYKLIDSMNRQFEKLQSRLRERNGQYVINLVPELKPNSNYRAFAESLKKILKQVSVNQEPNFSKSSFEEKYGETASIYMYEWIEGKYTQHEFIVRNPKSIDIVNSIKQSVCSVFSGNALIGFNTLKTNLGPLNNYIMGLNSELNQSQHNFFFTVSGTDGFIVNASTSEVPIADVKSNNYSNVYSVPKYSISQFLDLETLGKISEFTIDNPPYYNYLPDRPNHFLVDRTNSFNSAQVSTLREKLSTLNKTSDGCEFFIVFDNNNYGFEDQKSLADTHGYEWQIGGKERKGIVLIINKKNRKCYYRYFGGLESIMNVETAQKIVNSITPFLKAGNNMSAATTAIEMTEKVLLKK